MFSRKTLTEKWVPIVMTGVLSGLVTGIIVPQVEKENAKELFVFERKHEARTALARDLEAFIQVTARWRRIANRSTEGLSEGRIVKMRNTLDRLEDRMSILASDLSVSLANAEIYFGADFDGAAREFRDWQMSQAGAEIDASAPVGDYLRWRQEFHVAMLKEMGDVEAV